jgi:hypothetical protein
MSASCGNILYDQSFSHIEIECVVLASEVGSLVGSRISSFGRELHKARLGCVLKFPVAAFTIVAGAECVELII